MASIAFIPVCIGTLTGSRVITPGATRSTSWSFFLFIFDLPSSGIMSGSTTRPNNSSETGIDRIELVLVTLSPSRTLSAPSTITTPTLSVSRLRARPFAPDSNSSISMLCTFSRPYTDAIPSYTLATDPDSLTSMFVLLLSIAFSNSFTIFCTDILLFYLIICFNNVSNVASNILSFV